MVNGSPSPTILPCPQSSCQPFPLCHTEWYHEGMSRWLKALLWILFATLFGVELFVSSRGTAHGLQATAARKAAEEERAGAMGVPPKQPDADAKKWGTLTGRFVTASEGSDAQPRGAAGIAIYLEPAKDQNLLIHPKYDAEKRRAEVRTVEIRDSRFEPGVVFLRTKQPLLVKNADTISHVATNPRPGLSPVLAGSLRPGDVERFSFAEPGWQTIVCNLHRHGHAYLVVRPHPYGAVTQAEGSFTIEDLPVGEHAFRVWRPPTGYILEARVAGETVHWKRGLARIAIRPGANDLGDIQAPVPGLLRPAGE